MKKQTKNAEYYQNKSIIAGYIATGFLCGALTLGAISLFTNDYYYDKVNALEHSKENIIENFMQNEQFTNVWAQEFRKIADDYVARKITFEQFEAKIKHIQTIEYAQQVIENLDNNHFNKELAKIDEEISVVKQNQRDNIINPISTVGIAAGFAGCIGGLATSLGYIYKSESVEKKTKEENEQKL